MEENIATVIEKLEHLDRQVGAHFGWHSTYYDDYSRYYLEKKEEPERGSNFRHWVEVVRSYEAVQEVFNEVMITTKRDADEMEMAEHTLKDVFRDVEGTYLEKKVKQTIMSCLYTELDIKEQLQPILIELYG